MTQSRNSRLSIGRLVTLALFGFALTISSNTQDPFLYSRKVAELVPEQEATALGFTTAAGLIVAVLTQPIIGVFSDRMRSRWGRRIPFFVSGTLGAIVCLYLIALAPSWWLVVVGILLIQVFSNTVQGPWQALIPDQVPEAQRGQAASIKGVMEILAALVGGFAAGKIIAQHDQWGQWAVIAAATLPSLVFLIVLVLTVRGAREAPAEIGRRPSGSIRAALAHTFHIDLRSYPAFAWWFGNRLLFWAGLLIVRTFLILFARDVLGMLENQAQSYAAEITMVLGALLLVALVPAGWLSDRIGRKPLTAAAGLIAAAGVATLLISPSLTTVTVGGALVGLAAGIFVSTNWAMVTDIVPADEAARYLGMANIATAGGSLLGRLLGGALIDPVNRALDSDSAGYLIVYGIAALFFLASAVILTRMPALGGTHPSDGGQA